MRSGRSRTSFPRIRPRQPASRRDRLCCRFLPEFVGGRSLGSSAHPLNGWTNAKDSEPTERESLTSGTASWRHRSIGIVFRFSDRKYYVVRANALEDNFRLYAYDRGRRQFASATVKKPPPGQ
jgi:hypothetical protein